MRRSNRAITQSCVEMIKDYWREYAKRFGVYTPKVDFDPVTFAIKSDMVNGLPPIKQKAFSR